MIPERFRVRCYMCSDELDMRAPGVFAFTHGWVKNRREGGGNAVTLPVRSGEYACGACIEHEVAGSKKDQLSLFG